MNLPRLARTFQLLRAALAGGTLVMVGACNEQQQATPPEDFVGSLGRLVIDGTKNDDFRFIAGAPDGSRAGELALVPASGVRFPEAIRITTARLPPTLFDLRLEAPTQLPLQRNDVCWLRFLARAVKPQEATDLARIGVAFRTAEGRRRDIVAQTVYLPLNWTPIDLSFRVPLALEAGAGNVVFGLGSRPQEIELGGLTLRCFDSSVALEDLPSTQFSYAGREPDAAWRKAAARRIDELRKRNLEIAVVGADGQPADGAEIHVQMVRHAVAFGTTVDAELLAGQGPGGGPSQYSSEDTGRYRQLLGELFNTARFERDMTWKSWVDPAQRRMTEDALAWIDSLKLKLLGHGLITASWTELPPQLGVAQGDAAAARSAVRQRISETATQLGERVAAWQVLDQPRDHRELIDVLGQEEVDEWFRLARAAAPKTRLMINETEVLEGDHLEALVDMVRGMRERAAPLDAVGVEINIAGQPPPLDLLASRLDRLAELGLPVLITRLDIDSPNPQLQADYLRDLLILLYSHRAIEGMVLGGFWEGRQRRPNAALYGRDWTIKPGAEAYRELVFSRWWTDQLATGDAEGRVTIAAYAGDYQISARRGDQETTQLVTLGDQGASVTLTLPD